MMSFIRVNSGMQLGYRRSLEEVEEDKIAIIIMTTLVGSCVLRSFVVGCSLFLSHLALAHSKYQISKRLIVQVFYFVQLILVTFQEHS